MSGASVVSHGQPLPGTYMIYSRALSLTGERLAVTFNGSQELLTVSPLDTSNTKQHWIVDEHDAGGLMVMSNSGAPWYFRVKTNNGFAIEVDEDNLLWTINSATSNSIITREGDSGGEKQRWIFEKVPDKASITVPVVDAAIGSVKTPQAWVVVQDSVVFTTKYTLHVMMPNSVTDVNEHYALNVNADVFISRFNSKDAPKARTLTVVYTSMNQFLGYNGFQGSIGCGRFYLETDQGIIIKGEIEGGPVNGQTFVGVGTWTRS